MLNLLALSLTLLILKQDEIKRRLESDPLYLEKMLPYAVLFGETKHWLTFFTALKVSHPLWYHGNPSNMQHFSSSMNSASTPPSSGGSGSSGGGDLRAVEAAVPGSLGALREKEGERLCEVIFS